MSEQPENIEKRRSQRREAARTFRQRYPEKIRQNNQAYYSANQQAILEGLRRKRIDQIDPEGIWIHSSQVENEPDLPQSFNHTHADCQCTGRRCKNCEKVKCGGWFYHDKRSNTLTALCKICYGRRVKEYKQAHQDKVDASAARYTADSQEKRRRYWLKHLYNLTEEQLQEMYTQQHGKCAICGNVSDKALHVDHDHATGEVRALLCTRCNSLIGYANESIERLRQAIEYLEIYQKEET